MPSPQRLLNWFTPLPPARNGIADYAGMLLREVANLVPCVCYNEDPLAEVPPGVDVRDPLQAFRHLTPQSPILHQIGNNQGHVFVLDALRRFGGVTDLHDLSLLYLHELSTPKLVELYGRMQWPTRVLGEIYGRHWKVAGLKTAANYILFDMVGEVLSRSRSVIVHSDYARKKLTAVHGEAACSKIEVIPHFAKKISVTSKQARDDLGIDCNDMLLVTSGFATKVKRLDWLIDALDQLRQRGRSFRWVHAGEERADEYALTDAIRARPDLSQCCEVTGYLAEDKLDRYIAAADILINLRFPSVCECSGTLARAFSAGRCCVVNDTAAYAEIPRDAVVHVPVFDTAGALVRALDQLLVDRELRDTFGRRARLFARNSLSIETIAKRFVDVIAASYPDRAKSDRVKVNRSTWSGLRAPEPPISLSYDLDHELPDLSTVLGPVAKEFDLTLWFASAEHFAETSMRQPALVNAIVGPHVEVRSVRFVGAVGGDGKRDNQIGIRVEGRACG